MQIAPQTGPVTADQEPILTAARDITDWLIGSDHIDRDRAEDALAALPERLRTNPSPLIQATDPAPPEGTPSPTDPLACPPPRLVAGIANPGTVLRHLAETAPRPNGLVPRLIWIEPDLTAALRTLGLAANAHPHGSHGLTDQLSRTRLFLGPDAVQSCLNWLEDRLDERLPESLFAEQGRTDGLPTSIAAGLHRLLALQTARIRHARTTNAAATDQPSQIRRVLIFTSRLTAYVHHVAEDLAQALHRLGLEAHVLTERDPDSVPTMLYYSDAIRAHSPDLVININYMRAHMDASVPAGIPVLTWVQDAMPHLLAPDGNWTAGPLDFVAGCLYESFFDGFGFERARSLAWPNAVSESKFHPSPVDRSRYAHLRCEIAMATRHSEPPRAFLERHARALGFQNPLGRATLGIAAGIAPILECSSTQWRYMSSDLRSLTIEQMRSATGSDPAPKAVDLMHSSVTLPLADLLFRQQVATWAAAIAQRRGWRLHLHGRGWSEHPTLAPWAQPELRHGEELRASYQMARVHLHATVRGPIHQRIAEIAMSGGLPLIRRTFEDADRSRNCVCNELFLHAEPDFFMVNGRHPGYFIANHPSAAMLAFQWARMGYQLGYDGTIGSSPSVLQLMQAANPLELPTPERDPNRLLFDPPEVTFADETELEQRIEAAMSDTHRDGLSHAIARRCRERFSLDRFAGAIIDLVHRAVVQG